MKPKSSKRQRKLYAVLCNVELTMRNITSKIEALRDAIILNHEKENSPSVYKIAQLASQYNRLERQRKFLINKLNNKK